MIFFISNGFLLNFFLFLLGIFGILLNRYNLIIILISIELILLSINLNFIFFSFYLDDVLGEIFSLIILTVAAAESAIGLALMVIYFRVNHSISIDNIGLLSL